MKLKKLFSLKRILLFSILLILGSFIQKSSPVIQPDAPFIYEFGIALPWVCIYMDKGYGLLYFWEGLFHKGYLGIEIFPQYILLCAVVLNLLLSFKKWKELFIFHKSCQTFQSANTMSIKLTSFSYADSKCFWLLQIE